MRRNLNVFAIRPFDVTLMYSKYIHVQHIDGWMHIERKVVTFLKLNCLILYMGAFRISVHQRALLEALLQLGLAQILLLIDNF